MEYENCINYLTEKGIANDKATTIIENIVESLKKDNKMASVEPEIVEKMIKLAIDRKFSNNLPEDYVIGVCVGMTRQFDANGKKRRTAEEMFKKDKTLAISEGLVREDMNGNPIALHTKYLDRNCTIEDKKFGEDLEERPQRTVFFLIDGEIKECRANIDPEIGSEYKIFGEVNGKYINKVWKSRIAKTRDLTKEEFWALLMAFAETYEFTMADVDQVQETDPWTPILVTGFVKSAGYGKKGGLFVNLEDTNSYDPLLLFSGNEVVQASGQELATGHELIIFGQVSAFGDQNVVNILGYVINPMSSVYTDVVDSIDELICIE